MHKIYLILIILIILIILFCFFNKYISEIVFFLPLLEMNNLLLLFLSHNKKYSEKVLNNTLYKMCNILNNENVNGWFIGYGTLLGIIRNNSCIDNDDDIDILIDIKNKYLIDMIIKKYKFKLLVRHKYYYSIYINSNLSKIDFYLCDVDNLGNYNDGWNDIIWTNVNPIKKLEWNNTILNIPKNFEKKLINKYGKNWRTPIRNYKGVKNKYL
jgi:hypothetical protein